MDSAGEIPPFTIPIRTKILGISFTDNLEDVGQSLTPTEGTSVKIVEKPAKISTMVHGIGRGGSSKTSSFSLLLPP
jgi:hypothetical protein